MIQNYLFEPAISADYQGGGDFFENSGAGESELMRYKYQTYGEYTGNGEGNMTPYPYRDEL